MQQMPVPERKRSRAPKALWLLPVLIAILTGALAFLPDDDWTAKIVAALKQYNDRYPVEKVYLHLDKDYYASGETIWFKGYVTLQNLPDTRATNLYVELVDKNGNVVQKKLLAIANSTAAGALELPETQKPGLYQLRAYTSWMLNFDPAFLYYRTIEIFDPQKRNAMQSADTAARLAVQLFPESGDLIKGQSNRVAFKAIDQNGYPIAVNGSVRNNKGATVASLQTRHDGMGVFELTPESGETYEAVVQAVNGVQQAVALPEAKSAGAGLKVFTRGRRIFYQAMVADPADSATNQMLLLAQMGHQLVYKAPLSVAEGRISGFIPVDPMVSGIMQLALFSKAGQPLAERLAFVRKNDLLSLQLEQPGINTEARTKNTVTLKVQDTLFTTLSVAVTDADQVAEDPDGNNIVSGLLLTSDLKGYIHNPAWYFRDTTQETLNALDLLMMTNGWRRFSWQKILNDEYPALKFPYEEGILLKGTAFTNNGRYPLANGKVDFIIKQPLDSSSLIASAPTNDKGEFGVANLIFQDTAQVYYQGNDGQKRWKDVQVKFNTHFFENRTLLTLPYPLRLPAPVDNTVLKNFLATASEGNKVNRAINSKTVYLREVNVRERKIAPQESMDKRYTSGMFSGGDAYTFDMTKETPSYFNIFQYLQARVAGLSINGDLNNPFITWRGGRPALFLNEMQADAGMLSTVPVTDIAMVKVFRPPFMGGFGGGSGAIAVYTKRGGEGGSDPTLRGFDLYKKPGYALVKEFYSPDYSVKKEVHALPDKRLTLYWNPNLVVDSASHTARITFYNNDFSRRFRVVVEGMGEDGTVGRTEQIY